jgi:ligand-binding sensor domain-containing protein
MPIKKYIYLFVIVATATLYSQKIGTWKNYSNMDNVTSVKSTNNGFWIATTGGAGYYENAVNSFQLFLTNSEGLSSQNITALAIDKTNRIWLGMQNGMLDIFDPEDNSAISIKDIYNSAHSAKKITDIKIKNDTAYIATEFGLSLINTENLAFISTTLKFGNFPSSTNVNSVSVKNKIYIATGKGVAIQKNTSSNLVAPESWTTYLTGTDIPANEISATDIFNNSLIAATDKGLYKLSGSTWIKYYYSSPAIDIKTFGNKLFVLFDHSLHSYNGATDTTILTIADRKLRKLEITDDGTILIASNYGTLRIKDNNAEALYPNGPVNNSFESLTVDKDGALWVGTGNDKGGMGFMKFDNGVWTNYNTNSYPDLPSNNYHHVSSDNKNVYLSNWGAGLTIEENGKFTFLNATNSELIGIPGYPDYVVIMDAIRDNNNNLWIFNFASADGKPIIQLTANSKWYHYRFPFFGITEKMFIEKGAIDQFNTKWFTVHERGLFYFNEKGTPDINGDDVWGWLKSTNGLNSDVVTALAVDKRGELWIGTDKGVNILANPNYPKSLITSVFTLRQQSITSITVDPLNNKWVGTHQGVFVMTPDGTHLIAQYDSKNSPLSSDIITSIAIDKNSGLVYIGTSYGLTTLTTSSIEPVHEFKDIVIYPSPFKIGKHTQVTFDGLVKNSKLKIFSVSGKLIKTLETPGGRIAYWNGKDESGNYVASGIYLLVAYDEEADKITTSKFAVIH